MKRQIFNTIHRGVLTAALATGLVLGAAPAYAAQGDCSQPLSTGSQPVATDCLFILRAAVSLVTCEPECVCAPTGTLPVSASDALACLTIVVGGAFVPNCPCSTTSSSTSSTSTTLDATTTTSTTTTTIPARGPCPDHVRLRLLAAAGDLCSTNGDCEVGFCDGGTGRCRTPTELDTGWTGIAHDSDITDEVSYVNKISCAAGEAPCGQCTISGLAAQDRNCRCINDSRAICDEPFVADNDDCGGDICTCYLGPPLALSAGATPACVVNRFSQDISGTANVDTGAGSAEVDLRSVVHLGINIIEPCPSCQGDTTPGDGVRDGTCQDGDNDGASCDVDGIHRTFPAPGGGGHSLDCFPSAGKNVSGAGLVISLTPTTGVSSIPARGVDCGFPPFAPLLCHCGVCKAEPALTCTSNADCAGGDVCEALGLTGQGVVGQPNDCQAGVCNDAGGGEGSCDGGPDESFCDGVVRGNGKGFIGCLGNADCEPGAIGIDAGACSIVARRECFLDAINVSGTPAPNQPVAATTFCIPATSNSGINGVAGLVGPGRVSNQLATTTFCDASLTDTYEPGVGGCPTGP